MKQRVKKEQSTMIIDGKPVYYFVADLTTNNSILYKLYPIKTSWDLYTAKACGECFNGNEATVYAKIPLIERDAALKTIAMALRDIGVLKKWQ